MILLPYEKIVEKYAHYDEAIVRECLNIVDEARMETLSQVAGFSGIMKHRYSHMLRGGHTEKTIERALKLYADLSIDDAPLVIAAKYKQIDIEVKHAVWATINPVYFMQKILKIEEIAWTQKIMCKLCEDYEQVAVRSATACGKSYVLGRLALWFYLTRRNSKVVMTAPTTRQAINILWGEFTNGWHRFKSLYPQLFDKKGVYWSKSRPHTAGFFQGTYDLHNDAQWLAMAFSVKDYQPEALQGFHSPYMMIIVDEGSGVPDKIYEAIDRITTGTVSLKYFIISNPTRKSGFFARIFDYEVPAWQTYWISGFDAHNVMLDIAGKWVKRKTGYLKRIAGLLSFEDILRHAAKYGVYSDRFRINIMGMFPQTDEDTFLTYEEIEKSFVERKDLVGDERSIPVIGIDPSRGYNSVCAVVLRRGNVVLDKKELRGQKSFEYQAEQFDRWFASKSFFPNKNIDARRVVPVIVETAGLGWGFYEVLRNRGYNVYEYKPSGSPLDKDGEARFYNQRSECYYGLREAVKSGNLKMPRDSIWYELASLNYETDNKGRFKMKGKPRDKNITFDFADALAATFQRNFYHKEMSFLGFGERLAGDKFIDTYEQLWQME